MASLKALTLASVAVLALASSAFAADLLPPPPNLEPLPPAQSPDFSGWYLRGDIGLAANASSISLKTSPDPIEAGGYVGASEGFSNTSLSSSELADVGVGYQFNHWLRGDITAEYRDGGHFQSLYTLNIPASGTQYANFYRGDVSSMIGMANLYADVGTWYGITPFVGGGVGLARNTLYGMTDTGQVYTPTFGGPSGGYFSNGSTTNFAWALMAGLDFNIAPNLKLELGYRYLNYGKVASGPSSCLNGTGQGNGFSVASCGGSNYTIASDRLASNDFKLGLIWMINDVPAPPPPELPLVRKY
jgi:opacity protein-like surface antigen